MDDYSDLFIQFLVIVQPYSQSSLTLYQIEVFHVPRIDQILHADSYTEIQISKLYIVLNDEMYISLRHHE